jgi:Asp-tRNA(Asn)/Glu-tRNA(Gln) amidotransferase A subunit family amidase
MPTAHNSPIYKDEPASLVDAAPIITLRAAGALIFGKTTTTEFASTTVGGPSANPHDPSRTPGGSSSGSGVAVGDFQVCSSPGLFHKTTLNIPQVPIAIGTQTGGSTIRPGSFNGIYAFKPTWGAISREGLTQYSMTCDTLGLYARAVTDLELLSSIFQLADDTLVPSTSFSISGSKIAFVKTHVWPKAGPGLEKAWEKAKALLEEKGASIEEIELPKEFKSITKWHADVLAGEGRTSFLGSEFSTLPALDFRFE